MPDKEKDAESAYESAVEEHRETRTEDAGVSVPLARVKRVIKQDDDIISVSNSSVVAVAAATEMFIQYLTEQATLAARGEKRKKLQYNDFASAVAAHDNLEFLSTLVPKAVPYRAIKERASRGGQQSATTSTTSNTTSEQAPAQQQQQQQSQQPDHMKGQSTLTGFTRPAQEQRPASEDQAQYVQPAQAAAQPAQPPQPVQAGQPPMVHPMVQQPGYPPMQPGMAPGMSVHHQLPPPQPIAGHYQQYPPQAYPGQAPPPPQYGQPQHLPPPPVNPYQPPHPSLQHFAYQQDPNRR